MGERYSRQELFKGIAGDGQELLRSARVLIAGCGALGSAHAEALGRAGVGFIRIVDRDFVETSNLQRQTMFTENDAAQRLPKAVAAANHLGEINSEITVEPHVADLTLSNVEQLISSCDVVLDGTDNFSTRFLINDACVKHDITWIYGAAVGSYGLTMTVRPHQTACLRCVFEEIPDAGGPTCDTAGVIMPIINLVAATQVTETMKLIVGQLSQLHNSLMQFDVWENKFRAVKVERVESCVTCGQGIFETLDADATQSAAILCGRDAIQISPPRPTNLDLASLAQRLRDLGEVMLNEYLLRFRTDKYELTVFKDARSIIRGTDQVATARSLYAKFIGT